MIARIKKENGLVYDTIVFAFFMDGWNTKIIGFDETLQTLEYISYDLDEPDEMKYYALESREYFYETTMSTIDILKGAPQ